MTGIALSMASKRCVGSMENVPLRHDCSKKKKDLPKVAVERLR